MEFPLINSFHFLCVEMLLSLFCSLGSITIHRVCPSCCINPGTTNLRVCQAGMGTLVSRQLPASCHSQPCIRTSSSCLATFSCSVALFVLRQVRTVVHPSSILDVDHEARNPSKTPDEPTDNGVSSSIAFAGRDLITRPSPFRATKCSSVLKTFSKKCPRATFPS